MSCVVLGVDIGLRGAVALIDADDGALIDVLDMSVRDDGIGGRPQIDVTALADIVMISGASKAYVEHVSARPGEGAVGALSFGRYRGGVEGVLAACGLPAASLTPACWKRAVGIPPGRVGAKDAACAETGRRWPDKAGLPARVKDADRAESLIGVAGLMKEVVE